MGNRLDVAFAGDKLQGEGDKFEGEALPAGMRAEKQTIEFRDVPEEAHPQAARRLISDPAKQMSCMEVSAVELVAGWPMVFAFVAHGTDSEDFEKLVHATDDCDPRVRC